MDYQLADALTKDPDAQSLQEIAETDQPRLVHKIPDVVRDKHNHACEPPTGARIKDKVIPV